MRSPVPEPALRSALNPGVARRELFGWAMYDFANSGYTTVVLTAVFNAYFVKTVAGGAPCREVRSAQRTCAPTLSMSRALPTRAAMSSRTSPLSCSGWARLGEETAAT